MSRCKLSILAIVLGALLMTGADEAHAQFGHRHDHGYDYSRQPRFGARSHLDALSIDLQSRANAICWEMYNNYQRNRGWRETYAEAYKLLQDSKHIRQLVHAAEHHGARNELQHIAADLAEIDELFHHIEEDIARWRPARVDPHDHHFHAHPDLRTLVEDYEETLHHLMADYGVKSQLPPAPGGNNDAPPPPGAFR
jgi:hypothetical protein